MNKSLTHDIYKNYYVYGAKNNKFKIYFFVIAISVAVVMLMVSLFINKSPTKFFNAKDFYFVYASKYTNRTKAQEMSVKVSDLGGAGTLYCVGNTIFVVISAYNTIADAQSVKEQVKTTFTDADIIKVSSKSFSKSASKSVHSLSPCKSYYTELYQFCMDLYTWGNSYDIGELDSSKLYKNIMRVKQNISNIMVGLKDLDNKFANCMYSSGLVMTEHIGSFFSSAFVSSNLTKYVKKLYINSIIEFLDMCSFI